MGVGGRCSIVGGAGKRGHLSQESRVDYPVVTTSTVPQASKYCGRREGLNTIRLQNPQNLISYTTIIALALVHPKPARTKRAERTGDDPHHGHAVAVPQYDTDLARRGPLLGQLADLVHDLVGRDLQPGGRGAGVGDGGFGDAFAFGVEAAHLCGLGSGGVCCAVVWWGG